MDGLWASPDLTAVVRVAARNITGLRWVAPPACARCGYRSRRSRGIRRATPRAQPPQHRRPLRPRQRALRADARRDDDVLLRVLPAPRMTLAEASAAKLERVCRQARPPGRGPRAGDRHGMGRLRAARRQRAAVASRPPRSRASSTSTPAARARGRGSPIVSPCCARTTATCAGSYDKLVSIEMIEAVGWRDFDTFFARCSQPARRRRQRCCCRRSSSTTAPTRSRRPRGASSARTSFPNGCLPSLEVIARCVARERTCVPSDSRTSRHITPRRCGAGARTSRPPARASRPRLRRALSTPVADLPRLLRGWLRRAADRRRADAPGQAAMARIRRSRPRPGETPLAVASEVVEALKWPNLLFRSGAACQLLEAPSRDYRDTPASPASASVSMTSQQAAESDDKQQRH